MTASLTPFLDAVPGWLAYVVIGALVFSEAALFVGFVLPGETAVLVGAALASTGRLSVTGLAVVVVLCAIVGDSVGYEVGRVAGPRLLDVRLLRRHRARIDRLRDRLRTRGGSVVVLGRFTALLRALTPALCGMSRMPYPRFLAWNAVGGLLWGVAVVLLGYAAGTSYQLIERSLGGVGAVLLAVFVIAGIVFWRRSREAQGEEAQGEEDGSGADGADGADRADDAAPDAGDHGRTSTGDEAV